MHCRVGAVHLNRPNFSYRLRAIEVNSRKLSESIAPTSRKIRNRPGIWLGNKAAVDTTAPKSIERQSGL
jgi:hypothetical protein